MGIIERISVAALVAVVSLAGARAGVPAKAPVPELRVVHGATQLFVDNQPFLVRGGELDNSSASSEAFMAPIWPKLKAMNLNTVLVPAYWELIEPQEGRFDFKSVDVLIANARKNNMRVVLLWFGSWKNSMSCYVPAWVKRDQSRFPRAQTSDGKGLEILSAHSGENLKTDIRAYVALLKHIRETDPRRTVIMVQPENEVGMIPEARDHSAVADAAFKAPVPSTLTDYLAAHKDTLAPAIRQAWAANGFKTGANWEETFGAGPATDEIFNAWFEGLYTGKVAAAGKAVYPLPTFVNAALIRPGRLPGQYPSGGPLPQVFDVWRAAGPAIDMLSPDLYFPNFVEWALRYETPGRGFFIPETGRVSAAEMAANGLWAYARLNAIGFSPYAPEFLSADEQKVLASGYDAVGQLAPQILTAQGTGRLVGVRPPTSFEGVKDLSPQKITLGRYTFDVHFKAPPPISIGQKEEVELPGAHGGFILQIGPDEFLVAGTGLYVYFGTVDGAVGGIESVDEGRYVAGRWVPGRRLNGDETNQGRHLFVPTGSFSIHRVRLYAYH